MFNSLIAKVKEIVKMVDDSACEIIGIGTVKVTERDGTVRALERSGMSQRHDTILYP